MMSIPFDQWTTDTPTIESDIDPTAYPELVKRVIGHSVRLPLPLARHAYNRLERPLKKPILFYYHELIPPHLIWLEITADKLIETYTAQIGRGEGEIDTLDTALEYIEEQGSGSLRVPGALVTTRDPDLLNWYSFCSPSRVSQKLKVRIGATKEQERKAKRLQRVMKDALGERVMYAREIKGLDDSVLA